MILNQCDKEQDKTALRCNRVRRPSLTKLRSSVLTQNQDELGAQEHRAMPGRADSIRLPLIRSERTWDLQFADFGVAFHPMQLRYGQAQPPEIPAQPTSER
jgi:hypothetical protein